MIMTRGNIQIVFTNANYDTYFAGQEIQGHVALNVGTSGCKARKIEMRLKGECIVRWQESHQVSYTDAQGRSRTRTETVTKQEYEEYFRTVIPLWRSAESTGFLYPGFQTLAFSYRLPEYIPSSFEGRHGHIRYSAKVEVDIPMGFNWKKEQPFTVNTVYDLNSDPDAQKQFIDEKHKRLCCLCCQSGPICAVVKLNRRGFVSGEAIIIDAEIDNQSSRRVKGSRATLIQTTVFRAQGSVKKETRIIAEQNKGEVLKGTSDSWEGTALVVPSIPPSKLLFCRLIEVSYSLQFTVEPSGLSFDLTFTVPLIIGNIPFRQHFNNFYRPGRVTLEENQQPSAPPADMAMNPLLANHPDLPPPSYHKTVYRADYYPGEEGSTSGEDNEKDFLPRYVCYRMNQPSAPPM